MPDRTSPCCVDRSASQRSDGIQMEGEVMNTSSASTDETLFTVKRLTVAVPSVREFQRSYENAVPTVPLDEVMALIRRRAPWSEMVQLIATNAQYGFLIYFRNDVH